MENNAQGTSSELGWALSTLEARAQDETRSDEDRLAAAQALLQTAGLYGKHEWSAVAINLLKGLALSSGDPEVFLTCVSYVLGSEEPKDEEREAPFFMRGPLT